MLTRKIGLGMSVLGAGALREDIPRCHLSGGVEGSWCSILHTHARERRRQLQYDPKPLGPLHNFNYRNESSPFQDASHKIIQCVRRLRSRYSLNIDQQRVLATAKPRWA